MIISKKRQCFTLAAPALAVFAMLANPNTVQAGDTDAATVLILDASGSMWGQLDDGRTKIEVARNVLGDFFAARNAAKPLGVIAYGHNRRGDCTDIEIIAATGQQDVSSLATRLTALNPKGKTPLGQSLRIAASQIPRTAEEADIVLVTDGLETCDIDPCAVADELASEGIRIRAHVVGFGLTEQEADALSCVPDKTGGLLLRPQTGAELADALMQVSQATPAKLPQSLLDAPLSWPARSRFVAAWSLAAGTPSPDAGQLDRFYWAPASDPTTRGAFAAEVEPAEEGNVELSTPESPGAWVLRLDRWVVGASDYQTLAQVDVEVTELGYSLVAPSSAMAGDSLAITWTGKAGERDWIGIWPADTDRTTAAPSASDYLSGAGGELALAVPVEPGAYEIRYIAEGLEGLTVQARQSLSVVEPLIKMTSAPAVPPGELFAVIYEGPAGGDTWIDITRPGETEVWGGGYAFGGYAYPKDFVAQNGKRRVELTAPDEAGDYALRVVISTNERRAVFWQTILVVQGAAVVPLELPVQAPAPLEKTEAPGAPASQLAPHDLAAASQGQALDITKDLMAALADQPPEVRAAISGILDAARNAKPGEAPDTAQLMAVIMELAAQGDSERADKSDEERQREEAKMGHGPDDGSDGRPWESYPYRCAPGAYCEIRDETTGLSFTLPSGWVADQPSSQPQSAGAAAAGALLPYPSAEFFEEGGNLNQIFLNPRQWVADNGHCVVTRAGTLCLWRNDAAPDDPVAFEALSTLQASLTTGTVLRRCGNEACQFAHPNPPFSGTLPPLWSTEVAELTPDGKLSSWFFDRDRAGNVKIVGLNQEGGENCVAASPGNMLCEFTPYISTDEMELIRTTLQLSGSPTPPASTTKALNAAEARALLNKLVPNRILAPEQN